MSSSSCSLPTHGGSRRHKLPPPPSLSRICCCGISKHATRTLSWYIDKSGAPRAPPSSLTWPSPAKRGWSWDVTFALAQIHSADLVPLSWMGALGIGNGANGDRPPQEPRPPPCALRHPRPPGHDRPKRGLRCLEGQGRQQRDRPRLCRRGSATCSHYMQSVLKSKFQHSFFKIEMNW